MQRARAQEGWPWGLGGEHRARAQEGWPWGLGGSTARGRKRGKTGPRVGAAGAAGSWRKCVAPCRAGTTQLLPGQSAMTLGQPDTSGRKTVPRSPEGLTLQSAAGKQKDTTTQMQEEGPHGHGPQGRGKGQGSLLTGGGGKGSCTLHTEHLITWQARSGPRVTALRYAAFVFILTSPKWGCLLGDDETQHH